MTIASLPKAKTKQAEHHLRYKCYRSVCASWSSEIPAHWQIRKLKYLAQLNPSKSELSGIDRSIHVSFLPMEKVGVDGTLQLDTVKTLAEVYQGFSYFRNGDVLVAKITPCFENGKGALACNLNNGLGFGTTEFHVLRPGPAIDERYLELITRLHDFRNKGVSEFTGAAGQQRVPESFLINYIAPVPPLPEQRAIVAFMDRETARIDALVTHKQRLIELLEEKRQAVISQAVTRGLDSAQQYKATNIPWLGSVPLHWEVKKLKHWVEFHNSRRIPLSAEERGDLAKIYPYYGASGIIDYVDRYLFDEEMVLIAEDGANLLSRSTPLGFVATGKYWVNNHAHILKPLDGKVNYWAERLNCISYEPFVSGSAQPKLTIEALANIEFAAPAGLEMERIVEYIATEQAKLVPARGAIEESISHLQEYRTALISAAVTGKIDVRNEVQLDG